MLKPFPFLNDGKNRRPPLAHLASIALHNGQIGTDRLRQINLVHDEQVGPRNPRSALPRHLVPARDVNDIDDEIGQLARVVGGEVVAAGFDEEQVRRELFLESLEREQVGGDVFADCGVRASASLDGADARRREGFVAR